MPDSGNVITEVKISELPAANQANATDQLEANQAGTTRSITVGQVAAGAAAVITDPMYANGADGACGANDLAALDTTLANQIAELPRLQLWAKTSIDVGSLIPGSDTCDPLPYLRKIFAAFDTPGLQGKHLVFGRQRAWKFGTRPTTGLGPQGQYLVPPQRCTLEWQREWDFTSYGASTSPTYMSRQGTYGAAKTVIGSVLKGATTVMVGPGQATELVYGQRLLIHTTTQQENLTGSFSLFDAGVTSRAENLIVQSVSGDTITLLHMVQDNYPDTTVPVIKTYDNQPTIRFVNPMAVGPGLVADDRFIDIRQGTNVTCEGGTISNFPHSYRIYSCLGGGIDGLKVYGIFRNAPGGGVAIGDNTQDFFVRNCETYWGGQMFMLTNSGVGYGVSRDITFTDCVTNAPFNGFSTHSMHERLRFTNCVVNNPESWGIDIRVPDTILRNCTVRGSDRAAVLLRIQANNITIDGLYAEDCLSGVQLEDVATYDYPPGDITIMNSKLVRIGGTGSHGAMEFVYSRSDGGVFPTLGNLRLHNNVIAMKDNTTAIDLAGKWTAPQITNNTFAAPAGFTPAGLSILLDTAPDGGTIDGSSDPYIVGNVQDDSYAKPVVRFSTGLVTHASQSVVDVTSTQVVGLTTATTLIAAQSGSAFSNLGATATVDVTLPATNNSTRQVFEFFVQAAQTLNISSTTSIRIGSDIPALNLRSNVVGAWARLTRVSNLSWVASVDNIANWTQDWSPFALATDLIAWWDVLLPPTSTSVAFRWTDLVTNYSLVQETEALRPSFDGAAVNFAGDRYLQGFSPIPATFPVGATPGCIWASVDQTVLPADATQRQIFSYGGTTLQTRAVGRTVSGGVNRAFSVIGNGAAGLSATEGTIDFSGAHYVAMLHDGAGLRTKIDATLSANVAVVGGTTTDRMRMAASSAGAADQFFNAKIKRVLITKLLSAPNQTALEAWLAARV